MPLNITIKGNAGPRLNALKEIISDLTEGIEAVGVKFRKLIKENFDAQGSPEPWTDLDLKYQAYKEKERPGAPILVFDGDLLGAATVKDAPGNISLVGPNWGRFGINIYDKDTFPAPYPLYHQQGKGVPQRKIVQLSAQDKTDLIDTTIFAFIKKQMRALYAKK